MLLDFELCLKTNCIFGRKAEEQVGKRIASLGKKKVLIHHDSGAFLYETGLLDKIMSLLAAEGLEYVELGGVKPNPRVSLVREGIEIVKKEGVDFLLAIGGGSSIDSAKAIGMGALYDGDVWDFYGKGVRAKATLPVGAVITYPATGSETSVSSVLNNDELGQKRSYNDQLIRPQFAFMDPELSFSLPRYLTACGIVDMYSHSFERYFWDTEEYGITDYFCESVFRALLNVGPKVIAEPHNYNYRAEIMWIASISHNDITGVGRITDGSSHALGQEISALYDTAHGATLAIMIPAWMRFVYKKRLHRFIRYAAQVFGLTYDGTNGEAIALESIRRTEAFFQSLGAPICFADAKLPTDKLDVMAKGAVTARNGALGNLIRLSEEDALAIYRDAARV